MTPDPPTRPPTIARPTVSRRLRAAARERSLPEVHGSVPVPTRQRGLSGARLLAFAGPGYLVAVGYMDPGNWATDIAGGARYGYTLLSRDHDLEPDGDPAAGDGRAARHRQRARPRAGVPRHATRGPSRSLLWLLAEIAIAATRPRRGDRRGHRAASCCSACRCWSACA